MSVPEGRAEMWGRVKGRLLVGPAVQNSDLGGSGLGTAPGENSVDAVPFL